jgi:hypothetical protein
VIKRDGEAKCILPPESHGKARCEPFVDTIVMQQCRIEFDDGSVRSIRQSVA